MLVDIDFIEEAYNRFLECSESAYLAEENKVAASAALEAKTLDVQKEFKDVNDARVLQYALTKETKGEKEALAEAEAALRKAQYEFRQAGIKVDMCNRLIEAMRVFMEAEDGAARRA